MIKKILLGLSFLVAACTTASSLILSEVDNSRTINTTIGEEITISLAGNATTGYSWLFTSTNGTLFKAIQESYAPDIHPTGMVGVGGKFTYKIKTLKKGTFSIIARYYRPWENFNPKRDKHYEFIFNVE